MSADQVGGKAATDGGVSEWSRGFWKDTRRGLSKTQVLDVSFNLAGNQN